MHTVSVNEFSALLQELITDGLGEETLYVLQPEHGAEPVTKILPRVLSTDGQLFDLELYSGVASDRPEYSIGAAFKRVRQILAQYPNAGEYTVTIFQCTYGAEPLAAIDIERTTLMTERFACTSTKK